MDRQSVPPINPYASPGQTDFETPPPPGASATGIVFWSFVFAAIVGLYVFSIGLGITATVLLMPPMVRTASVLARRAASGQALDLGERVIVLFSSVGGMIVATVASIIMLYGVCAVGRPATHPATRDGSITDSGLSMPERTGTSANERDV